jgi:hypothetical protein
LHCQYKFILTLAIFCSNIWFSSKALVKFIYDRFSCIVKAALKVTLNKWSFDVNSLFESLQTGVLFKQPCSKPMPYVVAGVWKYRNVLLVSVQILLVLFLEESVLQVWAWL